MDSKDRQIKELQEKVDAIEAQNIVLGSRLNQFYKLVAYTTLQAIKEDDSVKQEIKDKLLKVVLGKALVKEWHIVEGQPIEPILMGD